jgi:hypothetical protein
MIPDLDQQDEIDVDREVISEHEVKHAHGSVVLAITSTGYRDCYLTDSGSLDLNRLVCNIQYETGLQGSKC